MFYPTFSPHSPTGRGRNIQTEVRASPLLKVMPSPPRAQHGQQLNSSPSPHGQLHSSAAIVRDSSQPRPHPPHSPSVGRSCPARISTMLSHEQGSNASSTTKTPTLMVGYQNRGSNLISHVQPHSPLSRDTNRAVETNSKINVGRPIVTSVEVLETTQAMLVKYFESIISAFDTSRDFAVIRREYPVTKTLLAELSASYTSHSRPKRAVEARHDIMNEWILAAVAVPSQLQPFVDLVLAMYHAVSRMAVACVICHPVKDGEDSHLKTNQLTHQHTGIHLASALLHMFSECVEGAASHVEVKKEIEEAANKSAPISWAASAEELTSLLRHLQQASLQLNHQIHKWHTQSKAALPLSNNGMINFIIQNQALPSLVPSEKLLVDLDVSHLLLRVAPDTATSSISKAVPIEAISANNETSNQSPTTIASTVCEGQTHGTLVDPVDSVSNGTSRVVDQKEVTNNAQQHLAVPPFNERKATLVAFHSFTDVIRSLQHQISQQQNSMAGMGALLAGLIEGLSEGESGALSDQRNATQPNLGINAFVNMIASSLRQGDQTENVADEVGKLNESRETSNDNVASKGDDNLPSSQHDQEDAEEPWGSEDDEEHMDEVKAEVGENTNEQKTSLPAETPTASQTAENTLETALAALASGGAEMGISVQFCVALSRNKFHDELVAIFKPTSKFIKALVNDSRTPKDITEQTTGSRKEDTSSATDVFGALSAPLAAASPRSCEDRALIVPTSVQSTPIGSGISISPLFIASIVMAVEGQGGVDAWPFLGLSTDVIGRYCKDVVAEGILRREDNDRIGEGLKRHGRDLNSYDHFFTFIVLLIRSTIFDRKAFDLPLPYACAVYVIESLLRFGGVLNNEESTEASKYIFERIRPYLRSAAKAMDPEYFENVLKFTGMEEMDDDASINDVSTEARDLFIDTRLYTYVISNYKSALDALRIILFRIMTNLTPFASMPLPVAAGLFMSMFEMCCVDAPQASQVDVSEDSQRKRTKDFAEQILLNLDFTNKSWKAGPNGDPPETPLFLRQWLLENASDNDDAQTNGHRRLKAFLRLATSLSAIPLTGLPKQIDVVCRDELFKNNTASESNKDNADAPETPKNQRLGIFGRTCFYELVLPKYNSYKELKDALDEACDSICFSENNNIDLQRGNHEDKRENNPVSDNNHRVGDGWDMGELHL